MHAYSCYSNYPLSAIAGLGVGEQCLQLGEEVGDLVLRDRSRR
jgi:hypothetical protein